MRNVLSLPLQEVQTKVNLIDIAGAGQFQLLSLRDRQQFHDPDGRAARLGISSALWPLFGMVWPSAIQLATLFAQRRVNPRERILEIGCGLALVSLVAHRLGAQITASDRHPMAPVFLRENLRLNQLPATLVYMHGQWGLKSPVPEADASAPLLQGRFDRILASDVLYDRDAPTAVALFIDQHAHARAEVWVVDADRGHRPAFNRRMASHGFALIAEQRLAPLPGTQRGGRPYKGRMLAYRR